MSVRFDEIELLKEPELPSLPSPPPSTREAAAPPAIERQPEPVAARPLQPAVSPRPQRRLLKQQQRTDTASVFHRALAFLTDFSLFLALALALSPLVNFHGDSQTTLREEWPTLLGLAGFLFVLSYHYFVVGWLIWGKTVGGAIFDVRIVPSDGSLMTARRASRRWLAMFLSVISAGVGFLMAVLPGRRSFADRFSGTRAKSA